MQRRIALIATAVGVATFFLALYGVLGSASPVLAIVGLVLLAVGVVSVLASLRTSVLSKPNTITVAVVALGTALHMYEQVHASGRFPVGWLLWSLIPYAICLAVSTIPGMRIPSIAGVTVVLLIDLWVHHGVFVSPSSSTAALALAFVPLWTSLVFAPIVMFVTWLTASIWSGSRARRRT